MEGPAYLSRIRGLFPSWEEQSHRRKETGHGEGYTYVALDDSKRTITAGIYTWVNGSDERWLATLPMVAGGRERPARRS